MTAFWISFLFAAFEMLMIFIAISAISAGKRLLLFFILLLKITTYIIAMWFLIFNYFSFVIWCICGFTVGMPLSAFIYYIIRMFSFKKHR